MKKYQLMNNIMVLFVFVMTFAVAFVVSAAQSNHASLAGSAFYIFILGFAGSIICIAGRFAVLYYKAVQQKMLMKKAFMLFYLALWSVLFVWAFWVTLQLSNFSLECHSLSYYSAYQIFLLVILIAQWLGENFLRRGIELQ